jgi:hypothetical protein
VNDKPDSTIGNESGSAVCGTVTVLSSGCATAVQPTRGRSGQVLAGEVTDGVEGEE